MIETIDSIPLHSIPGFNPLVADYLADSLQVDGLYAHPLTVAGLGEAMAARDKYHTPRAALHEVLISQYAAIGLHTAVKTNIDLLLQPNTYTITAAHQPCLLMGPIFNIYKIAAAINLAKQLKAAYPQAHFVPIFWMGSEDHDADELNNTYLGNTRLEWPLADGEGGAFGRRGLASLLPILEQAKTLVAGVAADKLDTWMARMADFRNFAAFTQYIVDDLFGHQGLVVLDQDDQALKRLFTPIIADELIQSRATEVLHDQLARIETHYTVQARPRDINLFLLGDNFRERIIHVGDTYTIHNRTETFTTAEILALVDSHPERFSPNVILRPVYQEMVLPNIAFVGGAGEHSYWLQLKPLFEHYGVPYPVLAARPSFAMLSASIDKKYYKVGMSSIQYFGQIEATINDYVRQNLSADTMLTEEKTALEGLFDTLTTKVTAIDPTLTATVQGEKLRQVKALEAIEGKIIKAEKRKQEETVNQIRQVHASLFPDGSWQERHDNCLTWYQLDNSLVDEIVALADPLSRSWQLLRINP
jgi:bacillithiol synthase